MATSGSSNFTQTRNEIINDAFQLAGIYGVGRTISAEDQVVAENALNKMVKAWSAQGLHLWAKEEAVLFITPHVGEYTLGTGASEARLALASDTKVTQLNGAHSASATILVVDDTTGMTAGDNIGVVLTDATIDWTTIVSVDSSTGLTITAGLDSAAADNNLVYTFGTRIYKPLRIHSMRRVQGVDAGSTSTQSEIIISKLSSEDFHNLPNKTTGGTPTHFYYNPDVSNGVLKLWQRPSLPTWRFHLTISRILEDFDASTNTPDFPQEWLEVLTYQLASRLALSFRVDQQTITNLTQMASIMLENMLSWDNEVTSIQIIPNRRGY